MHETMEVEKGNNPGSANVYGEDQLVSRSASENIENDKGKEDSEGDEEEEDYKSKEDADEEEEEEEDDKSKEDADEEKEEEDDSSKAVEQETARNSSASYVVHENDPSESGNDAHDDTEDEEMRDVEESGNYGKDGESTGVEHLSEAVIGGANDCRDQHAHAEVIPLFKTYL